MKKKKVKVPKKPIEPKESIETQSISVPVKAIQFSKNKDDTEIILSIKDLTVTTNNKDEILTDIESISDDTAQMKIITYSFNKPHMIKKVSFINSLPTYTLNGVKMQFLDSNNKIVNEIILSTQEKFEYTFPPYSQKDTKAELYVKQIENSKAIAEAMINADALTALQTNVRIITDNLAIANKGVTDISKNILTYQNQMTDNSSNITSKSALIGENQAIIDEKNQEKKLETNIYIDSPVHAIKFIKNNGELKSANDSDYNDMPDYYDQKNKIQIGGLVVTYNNNLKLQNKSDFYDISYTPISGNNLSFIKTVLALNLRTDQPYLHAIAMPPNSNLDQEFNLTYFFKNSYILNSIIFRNPVYNTNPPFEALLKGVKMQFLDAANNIIINKILPKQEIYNFNILPLAQINAQITTLTNSNIEADIQIATFTNTQKTLKATIDGLIQNQNDAIAIVNTLTEGQSEAKNKVYIHSQTAIKSALTQVKISSDGLRDSFIYNNYINMYVSDDYINLIKEQQKKMLDQAIVYATKAKSTIYNILDQTKLPLAVQIQTPSNGLIQTLEPTELEKLITLQIDTQKELQDMSELYTQAQILLKTLSK